MTDRMLAEEKTAERIPLAFIDALVAKAEREGQLSNDEGD
jgi:hypothetical protein